MATSNALSKCQRRYLFEPCNHFVGRLDGCHVRTAMKNLLFPALCLFRHFAIKVSFPWTQNETDVYPKDPVIHRMLGSSLLYNKLKTIPDSHLDPKEYLKNVKDCVFIVGDLISQMDPKSELNDMMDVGLSKVLKDAFATISDNNLNLHVEVLNVLNLHIAAVRYAFGTFPLSGDSYMIGLLGQKFYVEHADVEKYRENQNEEEIVERWVEKFQIGVKFVTKEKFCITRRDGSLVQGLSHPILSHHMWMFESEFNREKWLSQRYPLSWKIADMDLCMHYRLPQCRSLFSFFRKL
ncbi:uncharacterized protein LOC114967653 isoform X1 [Acropora millepora]|uniref:uncharacterized protein LOC114967653 isoform X1 n=1 Tax=Acropora millepora TaxID=45264 RepID=UPI001CF36900|nr:uncharacterized protein LOC114967653 isoform X1 [Acropora millepora]